MNQQSKKHICPKCGEEALKIVNGNLKGTIMFVHKPTNQYRGNKVTFVEEEGCIVKIEDLKNTTE